MKLVAELVADTEMGSRTADGRYFFVNENSRRVDGSKMGFIRLSPCHL